MYDYQAIIIGFGKAGKTLAAFLAGQGWCVAMVEASAQMYGGTCINIGCIPTKTLVHDAELHGPGEQAFSQAMARKRQVTGLLREKNYQNLAGLEPVTVIDGRAEFIDPHRISVQGAAGTQVLSGERIFINTGAVSRWPAIDGLDRSQRSYDSTGLLQLTQRPARLGIIGGGYIGLEFASMFAQFGSAVTVFEEAGALLGREDRDMAQAIQQILSDAGVSFTFNAGVKQVRDVEGGVEVVHQGGVQSFDALLVAAGRVPNTAGLQLARAGVETDERGAVRVDAQLRSSVPHIWALGDVNGGPQFTYISLDDFRIVRDSLFGAGKRSTADRGAVPYSVFITPSFSRIGLSEDQARQQGRDIKVATLPAAAIPRARVLGDTRGLLKAVVDAQTGQILGVALLCRDAHEMINIVKTAMDAGLPYTRLRDQLFTHPTMSESLNDLFGLIG
ncbi:pyridine nucleotide-disulfide oxidoreductase [Serratia marcescens]|jgi:pyruvate/2-oxoglutarate dehydrogenase complex dihydrolipoamide dehydrogenase (E3) component|uniref:Pyridine nucleotide-disulfide oxidoreductase n=1 Tax=Serratia marcescens TaxID=615 RepID=A0AAP8TQ35_SERMA|nr:MULTISPECIES: reactive chlorine resistance oxidoreductase RclA [Serratia]MBH2704502.1 pyridine nucleotide-disulfide oxidoreductase [Serratia marcescens]MBH3130298.1 pyridine nucleotide-disulfide oxidoreductase [Serratia marcescens]MBH3190465.1 pyridine nucleotide-disulfide oxidoreductase [Serratia marcescens]MBH3258387.1 pyridine nucleotide-disulfide oxidoreductase [Serratia marcescens]MBM0402630.1 pyridine nucleotide-disulfide oxidoreductase [Serratia sp. 4542]